MRLRNFLCLPLLIAFSAAGLNAQVALFSENFNGCALPAGWQANASGNPNPTWSVGISQNDDAPGQSIDGSCFLFIDDEAEGNNTAGYTLSFTSPAFDASQHSTVLLTMDVHYRDWEDADDYLEILVTDGTTEKLVSRFDKGRKNDPNISDHFKVNADLALHTQSPAARLIIRYNDGNGAWSWWAGVDNIKIVGSGAGTNVVKETFNGCAKPAGWTTAIVHGQNDWVFGQIQSGSNAIFGGSSMDGSCFVYFDDDGIGGDAPPSRVRLLSPWFDGTQFGNYILNYDVILRYYKETLSVTVEHGSGAEFPVAKSEGDIGGPFFPDYEHATLDISFYRSQQMRVVFEFDDGDDWGWWAGIDNVKITGSGPAFDLCANAVQLTTGAPCVAGNNSAALFEGPPVTCADSSVAGVWYRWQADFSGLAKLSTHAAFNDVASVFTGTCAAPQLVVCNNRDEHGFTGETTYFTAQSGTQYLFRISGQEGGFGSPRGELCVEIDPGIAPVLPPNDDCPNAVSLTVNGNCTIGNNTNATMSATLPSLNLLARADLWYTFSAGSLAAGEKLEIQSNASFSDIITLYKGACNALQEVASNRHGGILELPPLNTGENYWVQIAGNFATIEGSLCPQLLKKQTNAPANDDCEAATAISVGASCMAESNLNASPSAYVPSCIQSVERDVWFSFVAPPSGSVQFNTGADFEHVLAVWHGGCNDLAQIFCAENPLRCNGFVPLAGLEAGQTYYVQIASRDGAAGDFCLKILNGSVAPDFLPLVLEVAEECIGQDSAELNLSVSGGVQPYTFTGNADGQILPGGEAYLVVVTDAAGCEQSISGTIDDCNAGCALSVTVEAEHPKCFGTATGSLSVTPANGTPPYQYHWSNNASTAAIANLPAGTYSVTVTDAGGCEAAISQTLNAPPALVLAPVTEQPQCSGDTNGAISSGASGGTQPYQYQWSNNAVTANISDLGPGDYTLTVTDANGCTATFTQTLTDPDPLLLSSVVMPPKCNGESSGFIIAGVDGGVEPYQYVWSNSAVTSTISALPAGTYMLTVTDANGCTTDKSHTLTDPPAIVIVQDAVTHPGQGLSNGAIAVSVSGGTGQYAYAWFKNNVLYSTGTEDLSNVPAGNYTLEVTDANGCKVTYSYNLTETVGTQNPGDAFYALVFPNPAGEKAVLALAFPQPTTLHLTLTDASGRMLHNLQLENVTERHIPLDLKNLPGGVYWLRILAGDAVVGRKIIVSR